MKFRYVAVIAPLLLTACASTGTVAPASFVAPRCDGPNFGEVDAKGRPKFDEIGMAKTAETELRASGVKAPHNTRWWNGCLQTFVNEDGREVMKFYDPNTLKELVTAQ